MENQRDRIEKYLRFKQFKNIAEFSKFLGLHQDHIGKVDVKGASGKLNKALAELCPDLNLTWVMTGKGEMIQGINEQHPEREHLQALFDRIATVLPNSASLIEHNDIVADILRDLRNSKEDDKSA